MNDRLLALLTPWLAAALTGQSVTWKNEEVSIAELQARAPRAAQTAADWQPFAAAAGYRMVLAEDAQVVLVLRGHYARRGARTERPEVRKLLASLDRTIESVDALLGPAGAELEPAVVVAATEADYPEVLAHVAVLDPRLAEWTKSGARSITGFVLSDPLVAAWLDDGVGQEEWDHHNELVHRTAQLLVRRRARQLPPWFALGIGWHFEELVRGNIYCFPHRSGFVWATEHGGWEKRLATSFEPSRRKRAGLPAELTIEEIADWDPGRDGGEFDTEKAYIAFGLARYLATHHPDAVARIARAFDETIQREWKVMVSDTDWVADPTYRLPAARQLEILESADQELRSRVTGAFVHGRLGAPRTGRQKR